MNKSSLLEDEQPHGAEPNFLKKGHTKATVPQIRKKAPLGSAGLHTHPTLTTDA